MAIAELATIRLRLIKVIARVVKSCSHIRLAIASVCPEIGVFKAITTCLRSAPTSPVRRKPSRPEPSPINVEKPLVLVAAKNAEADARPDRPTKPETPAVQRAHK
ncbi:MAG: transposase [Blastomonas sp.]|nr:transposase [Blastomonas sp.]